MKDKLNILMGFLILACVVVIILLFTGESEDKVDLKPTLSLNPSVIVMKIGETRVINYTVTNLDKYTIRWQSDNLEVADVNNGVVTGKKKGTANIMVTINENGLTETTKVIVNDIVPESIKLNKNNLELKVNDKEKLEYTLLPSNATDKSVTWESSNQKIAIINDGVVSCLSSGSTMITIKAVNGLKDTCNVTCKMNEVDVTSIKFDKSSYSIYIDNTVRINATVEPANATNKTLTWKSSNSKIATVNNGVVKGISNGSTTITVTDAKGKVSNSVTIVVNKRKVTISPKEITIVGDSRMVGLCNYNWYKNDGGVCIAKSSMGYNWLVQTAIPAVNRLASSRKKYIVTNLGVNDLGNINKYVGKYIELATKDWKNYHVFLLSVNPTSGSRSSMNARIESFNNTLKSGLSKYSNVTYCDSYSYLKRNGFESGDGLHYRENTSKVIYEQIKNCINDYYNG